MTERGTDILADIIDSFDSLDANLSKQMENEGCPNKGIEIVVGAVAKREIHCEPSPEAAVQGKS